MSWEYARDLSAFTAPPKRSLFARIRLFLSMSLFGAMLVVVDAITPIDELAASALRGAFSFVAAASSSGARPDGAAVTGPLMSVSAAPGTGSAAAAKGVANTAAPRLTLTPASGRPGAVVRVTGENFPRLRVQLLWDANSRDMPAVEANANGAFNATLKVPAGANGGNHVIAAGSSGMNTNGPPAVLASVVFGVTLALSPVPSSTATPALTSAPPTTAPTAAPSTFVPTQAPTAPPTVAPSSAPTTKAPTAPPTSSPTVAPTSAPTQPPAATSTPAAPTATPASGPAFAASYTSVPPTVWMTGETKTYSVTVRNIGTQTWPAGGTTAVRLGVAFGSGSNWFGSQRFSLPANVVAGATVTVNVTMTAPTSAGAYALVHQMVQEGVGWFAEYLWANVTLNAPAPAPTASATQTPAATPTPVTGGRVAALPRAPSSYAVPAGAVQVSSSAGLVSALASGTPQDIVLASGTYDSSAYFNNSAGHRIYSATLGGAILRAGLFMRGANGLVQGVTFDVSQPSTTLDNVIVYIVAPGSRVLDSTFYGHKVIADAVYATAPDGLVVQRVKVRDFIDNGILVHSWTTPARPTLFEDIDVNGATRAVPMSANGTAEACIWFGTKGTVRRALLRNCAWQGLWTGAANVGSIHEDIDVDDSGSGVYLEHYTTGSIFQRMRIGPNVPTGIICEADNWDGKPASVDNIIQDSTFSGGQIGIHFGRGTTRTTARRMTFVGQTVAGIYDYQGIDNSYYDNDYSRLAPGATAVIAIPR